MAVVGHSDLVPLAPMQAAAAPLTDLYDVALLDLDGVVYIGAHAVPGVPEALTAARGTGMHLAFVTNNAARTPAAVAAHLSELGIAADPVEVITSAQAGARYLAERLPVGAKVLVVGTSGLYEALEERGLSPVATAEPNVAAVIQGYSPDLNWHQLAEGAVVIGRGLPWVATNVDPTVPSPRGPLPGNGSLVAALRHATNATPVVTGKPDPTMHRETILRTGARRPLVVGDRLDTDIEGANRVGCASLLTFSGVTRPADLLAAPAELRPTYLSTDASGVLQAHAAVSSSEGRWSCGGWSVRAVEGGLELVRETAVRGSAANDSADGLDALRALALASWSAHDAGSSAAIRAVGAGETEELARLGLA